MFVLVDRIVVSAENRARIVDAAEIAYREAGEVIFEEVSAREETAERPTHRFSSAFECTNCHRPGNEPEPRLFSFNNPFGACPRCQGFGNTVDFDLNLVIPDKGLTLNDGAIDPWNRPKYRTWFTDLKKQAPALGVPLDVPWREMPEAAREIVLRGKGSFEGVFGFFAQMETQEVQAACARDAEQVSRLCGVSRVPRAAAARRGARRADQRAEHLPGDGADHRAGQGVFRRAEADADAGGDCRADPRRSAAAAEFSRRGGPGIPDAGPAGLDAVAAAKRSAFNWRRRWVRGWWARCTCSTSLRSACTRAIRRG